MIQDDLWLIEVNQGDPAGQARVEALTLAVALRTWSKMLSNSQGIWQCEVTHLVFFTM